MMDKSLKIWEIKKKKYESLRWCKRKIFHFLFNIFSFAHEVSEGNRVCPKEGREMCEKTRNYPKALQIILQRQKRVVYRKENKQEEMKTL